MEYEGYGDTNCCWCTWNNLQIPEKESEGTEDQGKNWIYLHNSAVKINKNSKKRPKETCCHSDSSERPPANTGVKKLTRSRIIIIIKKKYKKRTWHPINFAILANHRVKIKESEKIDKYLVFAREQKKTNCGTWGWRWY